MNDYLLSTVLGIIEGLTEFLPVSSTAHLRLAEALSNSMGWANVRLDDPFWKMYTIVIQLGAVLCLPVYFARRILKFFSTFPHGEHDDRTIFTHPVSMVFLAFVVTAIPALLMAKIIGKHLESLWVMGGALLIGGIVMWAVDATFRRPATFHVEDMTLAQALWIGAVQILSAVFPGTSRSMSTIAAGQVAGMNRASALEFSFFLSIPTMAAATLYDFYKTVIRHESEGKALPAVTMDPHRWTVLAIGFFVSFIVAIIVVHWFMGWVRKRGFTPFAIYRIVIGIYVLLWAWRGGH